MRYLLILSVILFSCGNTIYVVRHAEKQPVQAGASQIQANDPPLSAAGELRAVQLKEELKNQHINFIFSTNFKRTISTAQPLNESLGSTTIQVYSSRKDSMDEFIEKLKAIKKGNILVVGHSNTIDDIANKLAGKTVVPGDLADNEYDNIFILKRKGDTYSFSRKKYGAPSL